MNIREITDIASEAALQAPEKVRVVQLNKEGPYWEYDRRAREAMCAKAIELGCAEKDEEIRRFQDEKKYVWDSWQKVADFIQDSGELGELGQDKSQVALDGLRELLELRKTKSSPWISVKERMPTREEADESGDVVVTDGEGWWIHGIQHSFSANATHWMTFIPPPKPSEEEKMREEFEAWCKLAPSELEGRKIAWAAWQAARKS